MAPVFYVDCHNHTDHSNYRLRDCINKVEDLINYAIELGHNGVAITDHETIGGFLMAQKHYHKLIKEAKTEEEKEKLKNFRLILGNEIYLCRDGLCKENFIKGEDKYYHFILLAKDEIGNKQLRQLSTRAWSHSYETARMFRVPTYYSDLKEIIGANPGHVIASSACFTKGQKVRTIDGEKEIQDITTDDYILTSNGGWEQINYPTTRMYNGKGNVLTFTKEPLPITCTENHQFLVYENKQLIWKEAKDLKRNDKCLEPIEEIDYWNNNIIETNTIEEIVKYRDKSTNSKCYSKSIFRLPKTIIITPELMRTFGLWLADGHISYHLEYNKNEIGFTFSDEEFNTYYEGFVKKGLLDLGLTENNYYIYKREKQHRVDLSINKVEICLLFKWLFGVRHAKNKRIAPRLLHISKELDIELFFGYLLGDGYFRSRESGGEVVVTSISKKLINDFNLLSSSLGLSGSVTIAKEKTDCKGVHHKESYYLTFSNKILGSELSKKYNIEHLQLVNIFERSINKRIAEFIKINNNTYRFKKVKTNTVVDLNEQVYCLNTPSHNFVLNNIIVHNCLGSWIDGWILKHKAEIKADTPEWNGEFWNELYSWIENIQSIFGRENFFLELQPSKTSEEQKFVNKVLVHLGTYKMYIPYIITTDSHYLKKEEAPLHEAFLKSQDGDREVMDFYASTYLMSTDEIHEYMDDNIGAEMVNRGLANTKIIYDMCKDYDLTKPLHIPYVPSDTREPDMELINKYSDIKLLNQFATSPYDSDRHLARRIVEAIEKDPEERANQKMYEAIDVCLNSLWTSSEKMNTRWSGYLLQTSELVNLIWEKGNSLVGAGRGSGVGFVLLYLLGITQINPLREKSPMKHWRFLNPERASVLDIDIDTEGNKREQIIKALGEKYNVTNKCSDEIKDWNDIRISKVQTLKTEASKSAILTACRGIGIDIDEASYLASFIKAERGIARTLKQTFYGDEENGIEPDKTFVKLMTEEYPKVWDVAQRIEGLVCGVGRQICSL